MDTMKPCPFCGEQDDLDASFALSSDGAMNAGCMTCGSSGPIASSEKEAVTRWNHRKDRP